MHGRRFPGKLIAAARHWANAKPAAEDSGRGSAAAFGITVKGWKPADAVVEDLAGHFGFPLVGKDFPIWPENEISFRAFLKVRTQWITGAGGATGLDFNAVERQVMRMVRRRGLTQDQEDQILDDLDVMESVIVSEWAKESQRRSREAGSERGRRRR